MNTDDITSSPTSKPSSSECQFCYHTKPLSEFTEVIPCNHQICTTCIAHYCRTRIESGNNSRDKLWPCPWGDGWFKPIIDKTWRKNVKHLSFWENMKLKLTSSKQDRELHKMARTKQWRRCPKCCFYVQKICGCSHIQCRCGADFCYDCGRSMRWCFCKVSLRRLAQNYSGWRREQLERARYR